MDRTDLTVFYSPAGRLINHQRVSSNPDQRLTGFAILSFAWRAFVGPVVGLCQS